MNKVSDNSELLNFYYSSIMDIQDTIRAIDYKLGFLLVILIFPFSNLSKIFNTLIYLINSLHNLIVLVVAYFIIFTFLFSWLIAFIALARGMLAIHNPSEHIRDYPQKAGKFYAGNLFNFSILDSILNRKSVVSNVSFKHYLEDVKSNNDSEYLLEELVFEQNKLAYIRGIKLVRLKFSFYYTLIWLACGFLIWIWALCKKSL